MTLLLWPLYLLTSFSKFSKLGFNSTCIENIHVQASFRKSRGTKDQIANICWIIEKAREFQRNIYFCFIDYAKAFDCGLQQIGGKFFKIWKYQTTLPAS